MQNTIVTHVCSDRLNSVCLSLQTSNTSTFMLHELAKNPTLQDRVCEEIRSVMGGRESPTFQDLQKMSMIRGCVKETLRYDVINYHFA